VEILWRQKGVTPDAPPKYAPAGLLTANFTARGKGAAIQLAGEAAFQDVLVSSASGKVFRLDEKPPIGLAIDNGMLLYPADNSPAWFAAKISGKAVKENITGWIFGRENEPSSFFFSDIPHTQEEIAALITKGDTGLSSPFGNIESPGDVPLELQPVAAPVQSFFDLRTR
jgi:hypothetical protein